MAQHFLLTAAARTLSVTAVARMSEEEARATFQRIRWASNGGAPFCPKCGCTAVYAYTTRALWKCKACNHQFSVTSGTIFASRKLPIRDYLTAIALFVNAVKGISALQLGRDLDVSYKSAFVLAHKLREAIEAEQVTVEIGGEGKTAEVDGAYFGGHVKPENKKADRKDRRLVAEQTGKRQVVIVAREHKGRTLTFVVAKEADGVRIIRQRVLSGTVVHADEAAGWDALHASYDTRRVNHSIEYKSDAGACTNQAESFFSRLRRAEMGQHHRISAQYLNRYAAEMAWKEDNRRTPNGTQWNAMTGMALAHPVSRNWAGYWQRSRAA
jgi:transposase-like protein